MSVSRRFHSGEIPVTLNRYSGATRSVRLNLDRRRTLLPVMLVAILLAALPPVTVHAQTVLVPEQTVARVIHASPDTPPVDVYVDDELFVAGMSFGTVSGYLPIETGKHELEVVPAGGDLLQQVLVTVEIDFDVETFQLLAIQNYLNGVTLSAYGQDMSPIDGQGIARIRLIHLVPDANGLTLARPDGETIFDSVVPLTASKYEDIQAGSQTLTIRPERQTIAPLDQPLALLPNVDYDLVVIGQIRNDSLRVLPLVVATAQPCGQFLGIGGPASGCLRFVNASPDIPAVDVYVGDGQTPVVTGLAFGIVSPVLSVPSGDVEVRIVPTGGARDDDLTSNSLFVEDGDGFLLVSSGPADRAVIEDYDDSGLPLAGDQTRVSVIHQTNHNGMMDVAANGEPLVRALLESEESEARLVPAGTYVFEANANPDGNRIIQSPAVVLVAGQEYRIIVAGDTDEGIVTVVVAGLAVPTDIGIPAP